MSPSSCPLLSGCPARGGRAVHLLCAALAVCFALYLYLTWRELQRMEAKVTALAHQMSGLHTTTDAALKEMRAALEAPLEAAPATATAAAIPLPMAAVPLVFEHVAAMAAAAAGGGAPPAAVVHVHGDSDSDSEGDEYDEEADDRQIKSMLMSHLDGLEGLDGDGAEAGGDGAEAGDGDGGAPAAEEEAQPPAPSPRLRAAPRDLKLDELRRELKGLGLDARGAKDALVARLEAALAPQAP